MVVCDSDDLDLVGEASLDNCPVIGLFIRCGKRLVMPPQVLEWVDLKRAAIKPCSRGKRQRFLDRIGFVCHVSLMEPQSDGAAGEKANRNRGSITPSLPYPLLQPP